MWGQSEDSHGKIALVSSRKIAKREFLRVNAIEGGSLCAFGANNAIMLRITQQDSAKDAKRYYASADYYSEGQEIVGAWGGEGARRLGLEGTVDKHSFDRLCDNLDPRDGKQLTVRTRTDRTVGYDFTFSVPKSVSLLYALSGNRDILSAFRSAVDETMRDIESEMKTRVRRNGRDENR